MEQGICPIAVLYFASVLSLALKTGLLSSRVQILPQHYLVTILCHVTSSVK